MCLKLSSWKSGVNPELEGEQSSLGAGAGGDHQCSNGICGVVLWDHCSFGSSSQPGFAQLSHRKGGRETLTCATSWPSAS